MDVKTCDVLQPLRQSCINHDAMPFTSCQLQVKGDACQVEEGDPKSPLRKICLPLAHKVFLVSTFSHCILLDECLGELLATWLTIVRKRPINQTAETITVCTRTKRLDTKYSQY